jgi:hypothetical protein
MMPDARLSATLTASAQGIRSAFGSDTRRRR